MVKSKRNSKLHNAIHSRRHWIKETVIHVECEQGNFEIVKFLIDVEELY